MVVILAPNFSKRENLRSHFPGACSRDRREARTRGINYVIFVYSAVIVSMPLALTSPLCFYS